MRDERLEGGCLCGGVHYTAVGTPRRFYHCHCTRCRKTAGAAHATNVFVEGSLTWDRGGELIAQASCGGRCFLVANQSIGS
jgi:hypothetical protein